MNTYVVNLDKDTERLADMTRRLDRLKMPFSRISGVVIDSYPDRRIQLGMYGCAQSHLLAYQQIVAGCDGEGLILEDDAVMRDDLPERLEDLLGQLGEVPDWDVLYLGVCPAQIGQQVTANIWEQVSGLHTHAYVVSRAGAQKLIDWTTGGKWMYPGGIWDRFPSSIRKYFADPILAVQQPNFSNVGKIHVNRLDSYFRYFDKGEFFTNCAEARSWEPARRPTR